MTTLAASRHCTRACRSLKASWLKANRCQSTAAATEPAAATNASTGSSSLLVSSSELAPNEQTYTQRRRMSSKKQLSLARAISLYHHTLDFPDFLPPLADEPVNKHNLDLPATPPRADDYINNKIYDPLVPLEVRDRVANARSKPRPITQHRDPYSYIDQGERAIMSLASNGKSDTAKTNEISRKKWDALSPQASRETQIRARKMVDALLGTVDARKPGFRMVQAICEINKRSSGKLDPPK